MRTKKEKIIACLGHLTPKSIAKTIGCTPQYVYSVISEGGFSRVREFHKFKYKKVRVIYKKLGPSKREMALMGYQAELDGIHQSMVENNIKFNEIMSKLNEWGYGVDMSEKGYKIRPNITFNDGNNVQNQKRPQ